MNMSCKEIRKNKLLVQHYRKGGNSGIRLLMFMSLMLLLLISSHMKTCECRYLPTRSNNSHDLDKLRELMVQILESNNGEEQLPNHGSYYKDNTNDMSQHESWINKLDKSIDLDALKSMDMINKYYDRRVYKPVHY